MFSVVFPRLPLLRPALLALAPFLPLPFVDGVAACDDAPMVALNSWSLLETVFSPGSVGSFV